MSVCTNPKTDVKPTIKLIISKTAIYLLGL